MENNMKTLATLHTEQKEEFDEKFSKITAHRLQTWNLFGEPPAVNNFLTTSTLSQIDLMIEIVDEVAEGCEGEYDIKLHIDRDKLITLLQAQRKLIEEQ